MKKGAGKTGGKEGVKKLAARGKEKRKRLTLISSFYSVEPVMPAIHQLSPTKLVLFIHGGEKDAKARAEVKENVEKLRSLLSTVMQIEVVEANVFDVNATAAKTVKVIESEKKAGNRVVVNITGGRKILGLGVLFGAYARPDMVERVVYGAEFDPALVDLPKMSFRVGETKEKILRAAASGKGAANKVAVLARAAGVTAAMAYVHLRELKAQGYINDDYEITSAGRLALL